MTLPSLILFLADRGDTPSMEDSIFSTGNCRFYIQHSAYGTALERYLKCSDRGQIKVIAFERLIRSFDNVIKECFLCLGVADDVNVTRVHSNPTHQTTPDQRRARYRVRSVTSRAPWLKRFRRANQVLARIARGIAQKVPTTRDVETPTQKEDRAWLAQQFTGEVETLRAHLGEDFAEWGADFPLVDRRQSVCPQDRPESG